jgi:hypothetical protein
MPAYEIPRDAWIRELNEFTARHEGWLVSLDVVGPGLGAQTEIDSLPLLGVSADRVDHDGTIAVSVARSAVEHLTHIIQRVAHVNVERSDDGTTAGLLVESVDGTRTVLLLKAAPLPIGADLQLNARSEARHPRCQLPIGFGSALTR